ncbi:unnamed protein product [Brachionus calyciflorus]|uniref:Homologous recombination OB-fold protein OB-fold domain-containing protein n=1 Tax=Brachionus calyciflorus TaxID=104777 RepID=A0A814EV65_9BILA|nr:unnamed protein product [Brachionus calyciflorus]
MSAFNLTNSRIDLSQINDDDLNLDLDDDDNEENTFKKPVTIETDKNNNLNENDEDNNLFKIPKAHKINLDESIVGGFQKNLETTLNDLFENDQDEDEEDFLIRTQPMFSSTQSNSQRVFSPPSHKESTEKPNEIIISTQSVGELMMKKTNRLDETILIENLENDKTDFSVWRHAQHDLNQRLPLNGLDTDILKKYTLDFYYKKFFDYSLLRITENSLRKLPFLCVWIKEISRNDRNSNATVTLTDGVDSIKGTISKQITSNNWELLHIGCVLVLQNVCLLRVNYAKNGYHLNINKPNLLMIYHKKCEKKIHRSEFSELRSNQIKDFIDFFEKTYVFIDTSLIRNNTTINKSTLNLTTNTTTTNNNTVNKSNNQNHRSAPYQVPPQYKKQNSNFNRNHSNPNLNKNVQENNKIQKTTSDLNKVQSSDDVFSQLIFGIEDEFLKEDD